MEEDDGGGAAGASSLSSSAAGGPSGVLRGGGSAGAKAAKGPLITPATNVASASLPEHLRVSSITGEASTTLGFVQLIHSGDDHAQPPGRHGGDVEVFDDALQLGGGPHHHHPAAAMELDTPYVFDANINADQDADALDEEAAAADGAGGPAVGEDDAVSNEQLWQLLFAQEEEEQAAAPPQPGEGGQLAPAAPAPAPADGGDHDNGAVQQQPHHGPVDTSAAEGDDEWEDA